MSTTNGSEVTFRAGAKRSISEPGRWSPHCKGVA